MPTPPQAQTCSPRARSLTGIHHRTSRAGEHGGLPPDVVKTEDRGLTSTQSIAYTSDNSMARLHTETTSTLAATARVVDGFVPEQSDHRGSTLVVERSYSEDKAPCGRKGGDWINAQPLPEGRGAAGRLRINPSGGAVNPTTASSARSTATTVITTRRPGDGRSGILSGKKTCMH